MRDEELRQVRVVAWDRRGDEVGFQLRLVPLGERRWGAEAPDDLVDVVERDPRVRLEDGTAGAARVLRSGRTHAEVHGRLHPRRGARLREPRGPVVVIETGHGADH